MFNDSKYSKWYFSIVEGAKHQDRKTQYTEKHHIIPKSLGGTNKKENIVSLTPREHYICHLLLPRMINESSLKSKMWYAAWCLVSLRGRTKERVFRYNSRLFSKVREERSRIASIARTGKKHSEDTKKKIGEKSRKKVFSEEYRNKLSAAGLKRKDSEEVKARKSAAAKLRWASISEEHKKEHMLAAFNAQKRNSHS